jgi:O-antigen/teichoic acid export membrane protein
MMLNQLPGAKQIFTNFLALFSGMGLARLLTAVALILLARQVGPYSYGHYVACFSLAKLTSVGFAWGLDGWLLWSGGRSKDLGTVALNSGVAIVWKLILSVAWFPLLYFLAGWLNPEVFPLPVLLVSGLIVWADDLTNTAWSVFKSTFHNDITFKVITSVQLLLVLATIGLILLDTERLLDFLWARVAVTGFGCGLALYLLRRTIGLDFHVGQMKPIFLGAMPFAGSMILALIYERADVTIIGQFLGTREAGLYGPASTMTASLFLIPSSAYAVMVPVLTRSFSTDMDLFRRMLRLFTLVNVALGTVMAAGLFLTAEWIVNTLYGYEYAESGQVLAILSLVLGLRCITFALGAAVVATGFHGHRLRVQAVAAFLNVALNLLIVTRWGIEGVAWVYVFTEFVLMVGYWRLLIPASATPTGSDSR